MRNLNGQRGQCPSCNEYFNSIASFDKHRTGKFGEDRRCMTVEEMRSKGMCKNSSDFWVTALNPAFQAEGEQ